MWPESEVSAQGCLGRSQTVRGKRKPRALALRTASRDCVEVPGPTLAARMLGLS